MIVPSIVTVVGFLQVAAVAEGNATVTERATDEARSHAPSFIFFDMKFPFERGTRGTWGALQVGEKVLGSQAHLKQKVRNSGNALPKILTFFTVFYSSLHIRAGANNHKTVSNRGLGLSSRDMPRGGKTVKLMLRTPSAVNSSIEELSTTTLR